MLGLDTRKTLAELEGDRGREPKGDTSLTKRCHRLRREPLHALSVEDLRVLLSQSISPEVLLPLALETLEINPYVEGDHYEGDLLAAVMRLDKKAWRTAQSSPAELIETIQEAPLPFDIAPALKQQIDTFVQQHSF